MKAIGGYFGFEDEGGGSFPHNEGILLNTGRNALEYILRSILDITHIFIPYYTCPAVLVPIKKLEIPYTLYSINQFLEINDPIILKKGEYLIVNNYFGIKDAYINRLSSYYGSRLIVDCAQAFFYPYNSQSKFFYSIRKFIGVPDGGIAYGVPKVYFNSLEDDNSDDRCEHLRLRRNLGAEAGFKYYQINEVSLNNLPLRKMSNLTIRLCKNINYQKIVKQRIKNYHYLDKKLNHLNLLSLPEINSFKCPMCYPLLVKDSLIKREDLIKHQIYVPFYWPNIEYSESFAFEYEVANNLLALPIDQRYNEHDMDMVLDQIANITIR